MGWVVTVLAFDALNVMGVLFGLSSGVALVIL